MAKVKLQSVDKSFGTTHVIHSVDLDIDDREFVVFVGPSGCGKSTLLRMIAGLEDISGGEISIDERVVNDIEPAEREVAMVFQSYALYPHMTVRQNMGFGLRMTGVPAAEIEQKVNAAAKTLRLDQLLERKPKALSGGQRQRVAIGRAIVRNPKVFLFDEPLSNLDAELRVKMRVEIAELHQRLDATMIYVTHDQVEAMTLADKIVVLQGGIIEQVGAPLELYNKPRNEFVAGFIGSPRMNFMPANTIDGAPSNAVKVGMRPEHLRINADGKQAKVRVIERLGGESFVYANMADGGHDVTLSLAGDVDVKAGDTINFSPLPDTMHFFDDQGMRIDA